MSVEKTRSKGRKNARGANRGGRDRHPPHASRNLPPRPLYSIAGAVAGPSSYPDGAHAGLWYDKFCNQWQDEPRKHHPKANKLAWIQTVTSENLLIGNADLLENTVERRRLLISRNRGKAAYFKTEGRFVTGLGREHPVENGFAWHPTLGTPYLPGSGVKGVLRAFAREKDWDAKEQARIFGELDQIGTVVFLDAIPTAPVRLDADVMTPHYGDYYHGNTNADAPGDWLSPNPIPFLTVSANTPFQFGLLPRNSSDTKHLKDVETVLELLTEALAWLGAGAKTAVGYGRFIPTAPVEENERWARVRFEEESKTWPPRQRGQFKARSFTVQQALDWVRENLQDSPDLDDDYKLGIRDTLIERFYEPWCNGDTTDPIVSVSADKLRADYADSLVPPRDQPDDDPLAALPDDERQTIEQLHQTDDQDMTNALIAATDAAMAGDWSLDGLEMLFTLARDKWGGRRSRQRKRFKAFDQFVRARKKALQAKPG